MKILIVGGGGREHALAWRLWKSPSVTEVIVAPGNPGMEQIATCIPRPMDVPGLAAFAEQTNVDLTIVGPEAPLVAGVVDQFRSRGLRIIGPTQAAAQLEGSKMFAKSFFERAQIPTARSIQVTSIAAGLEALAQFPFPVVIKADGLAGGKGVIIAETLEDAEDAVNKLGPRLVIEEFLVGEEVSFIALVHADQVFPFAPSRDHKRAFDGDTGPNTGGMGAYCDSKILKPKQTSQIMDSVMLPAVTGMKKEGSDFTGFLYAGLMLTADGPKVLEFNVRMGDPETQAIMASLEGDFAEFLCSPEHNPIAFPRASACIVLTAQGYPEQPKTGDEITGIAEAEANGAVVFQAGTRKQDGKLVTNSGRVLGVTASGNSLEEAVDAAYAGAKLIHFEGAYYRTDIGRKAMHETRSARH